MILRQGVVGANQRAVRHGVEHFQQVRAAFGERQERLVTQGQCRQLQIAAGAFFKIQADQIDHALAGIFQIGTQMRGAEMVGDLDDAFWAVLTNAVEPAGREDAFLQAKAECLFQVRAAVDRSDGAGCVSHDFPRSDCRFFELARLDFLDQRCLQGLFGQLAEALHAVA